MKKLILVLAVSFVSPQGFACGDKDGKGRDPQALKEIEDAQKAEQLRIQKERELNQSIHRRMDRVK